MTVRKHRVLPNTIDVNEDVERFGDMGLNNDSAADARMNAKMTRRLRKINFAVWKAKALNTSTVSPKPSPADFDIPADSVASDPK